MNLRTNILRFLCGAVLLAITVTAPAHAADADPGDMRQEPALEGLYSDWSLYGLQENGSVICYLSSGLERASDPVPRRRQAYVLITNRPAEGRRGVVSVDPGYTYDDGSPVLMTIGRKQFQLVTKNGFAWAQDSEDPQIVAAIRNGSTLVVTGRMKNGPATTDTFSLRGFGQALAALDHSCPVAGAAPEAAPHKKRKKAR
jgi:invasion protein IalB